MPFFAANSEPDWVGFLPTSWFELCGIYLYMMVLLEQVAYVAINETEAETKARPWPWFGFTIGLLFPLISPVVHPVPPFGMVDQYFGLDLRGLWINGLLGLIAGSGLTIGIAQGWRPNSRRALLAGFGLVGLFLGWRSVVSVGLTAVLLGLLGAIAGWMSRRPASITPAWSVWLATVIELLVWRLFPGVRYWPSREASPVVMVIATLMAIGLANLIPMVGRRQVPPGNPQPVHSSS